MPPVVPAPRSEPATTFSVFAATCDLRTTLRRVPRVSRGASSSVSGSTPNAGMAPTLGLALPAMLRL
eukprot:1931341-Prymnesium_polylepis.1